MSAKSVFKMGFLSMIAATGLLFGTANGFADTGHTTSKSEGVRTNTGVEAEALEAAEDKPVVADEVQIPETPASRDHVVDSEGNFNRLTPPQTKGSKGYGERLPRYMPRTGLY